MTLAPENAAPKIARIQAAAASMHQLIDDLLAFTTSRDQALSPVVVDLDAMVRDLTRQRVDAAAPPRRPRFTFGDLPPVYAEPAQVRQLLDNLIGNAVKYVVPGTTADVAIMGTRLSDGWVQVSVIDRGIGIPDEQRERIFETFHRVHAENYAGTGIGLSICDRIVSRHGGHLGVEENPDGPGSRFVFTLPGVPQD
jgi:signal transduction histidine kinase